MSEVQTCRLHFSDAMPVSFDVRIYQGGGQVTTNISSDFPTSVPSSESFIAAREMMLVLQPLIQSVGPDVIAEHEYLEVHDFVRRALNAIAIRCIEKAHEQGRRIGEAETREGMADAMVQHVADTRAEFQRERDRYLEEIIARDGYYCRLCESTDDLAIDHDVPVAKGGQNTLSNLMLLCRSCNSKKGDRPHLQVVPEGAEAS